MAGGLFNIGTSALMAAYTQMRTTGHNIANVNTPGFSRQEVELSTTPGNFTGGGYIGRGVAIETISRQYDRFLSAEVATSVAAAAADSARTAQLGRLDRIFADPENGVGAGIDDLRAALADVANRPFDISARTAVVTRAATLAERFTNARGRLDDLRTQADLRVRESVNRLSTSLQQLGEVNLQILRGSSGKQPPNDLLDQRDRLIEEINQQMKGSVVINADQTVNMYAASGHSLVLGPTVASFSVAPDALDPTRLSVTMNTEGLALVLDGDEIGGGELAGQLRFRDQDLTTAQARLGQLAAAIGDAYNRQQALGIDPGGATGAPMFSVGTPLVSASTANAGTAVIAVSLADGSQVAASDYSLRFDGANWTATRISDGQQQPIAAFPATIDGLQLNLSAGAPAAGDTFLVRSASQFASGFRAALVSGTGLATGMAAIAQQTLANTGDARVSGFRVTSNDPNLTAPVSIQFTGPGTFNVVGAGTGAPTGVPYVPGTPISYNGWELTLLGVPAAGDSFTVTPTQNPAVDNRNARQMIALGDSPLVGGQRPTDAYSDLVADIGTRTQASQASEAMSTRTLDEAKLARSQVAGVNLDEEAARLLQYQQAYQAAAKVIATAQAIFDTLLQSTGG